MDTLQRLCQQNPALPVHDVRDAAFRPFGRVMDYDAEALIRHTRAVIPMPAQGVRYERAHYELESHIAKRHIQRVWRGGLPCQMGVCWGYNSRMDALEYHRSSECNIAVTDLVLLLARQQDMEGARLNAARVEAFFVPKGLSVEVYATSLHYAPCQTSDEGFMAIVVLPKGTNADMALPQGRTGEDRLLFAADKWLICHEDNQALIDQGAYPGLYGENHTVKY